MSNLKIGEKDYPAAASKHLTDAKLLFDGNRYDGAAYLAGYVVECSLSTVVMFGEMVRLDHDEAKEKRRRPVELKRALAPGSRALDFKGRAQDKLRRDHDLHELAKATTRYKDVVYPLPIDLDKPPFKHRPKLADIRYQAEGRLTKAEAQLWIETAETIYKESVVAMIRDGLITK